MELIYTVSVADAAHEAAFVVRGFRNHNDAVQFSIDCQQYDKLYKEIDTCDEDNEEKLWANFEEAEKWRDGHPLKGQISFPPQRYVVNQLEVY